MKQRLFFAVWPDSHLQEHIFKQTSKHLHGAGRQIQAQNLHITLRFLGMVGKQQYRCITLAADRVVARPFRLELNTVGYFPKPNVIWLGSDQESPLLNDLYTTLTSQLSDCGIEPEPRPFKTHLTLLRKVQRAPNHHWIPTLIWDVTEFVLVGSQTFPQGAQYQILKRWTLRRSD